MKPPCHQGTAMWAIRYIQGLKELSHFDMAVELPWFQSVANTVRTAQAWLQGPVDLYTLQDIDDNIS